MTADQRITDWLESGVVALSGLVPPGSAATQARRCSAPPADLVLMHAPRAAVQAAPDADFVRCTFHGGRIHE